MPKIKIMDTKNAIWTGSRRAQRRGGQYKLSRPKPVQQKKKMEEQEKMLEL